MAWKDPRGSARTVVVAARAVAHSDDSKHRADEASNLARRGFPRKLIAGSAVGAVALVTVVVLLNQKDDVTPAAAGEPTGTSASASPSATTPPAPTPEEVLTASVPTGEWKLRATLVSAVTRAGNQTREGYQPSTNTWTFSDAECTGQACKGTVTSTSGLSFPYKWNGTTLDVTRPKTDTDPAKQGCYDTETGEIQPVAESAFKRDFRYQAQPFRGSKNTMTSLFTTHIVWNVFGDCEVSDGDVLTLVEKQVITRLR